MKTNPGILSLCLGIFLGIASFAVISDVPEEQPMFTRENGILLLFYDVSSRRFRTARDALIRGDLVAAAGDLQTSAGHLRLEAERNDGALGVELGKVATQLMVLSGRVGDDDFLRTELDPVFARAHWLLAQQYLDWAEISRDRKRHKNAGGYLWAATHHLERALIWSNQRVDSDIALRLDELSSLANDLRSGSDPAAVYQEKPIRGARDLLGVLAPQLGFKIYPFAESSSSP